MTISEWMIDAMVRLKRADIPNGRTDALVLLSDLFDVDKSWVHTNPDHILDELQLREINFLLDKRIDHTPLAYIRGHTEFYKRQFLVNSQVLVPRPESESFITIAKTLEFEVPRIADIGTGSGCLGISAGLEISDAIVHLYDISPEALAVARHNATALDQSVMLYQSDLLQNLQHGLYDIVLANLPYVPKNLITGPEILREPAIALFSGIDGLQHYRRFWQQTRELKIQPRYILTESLENQHGSVQTLAKNAGYRLMRTDVLVQLFKR